MTKTYTPKTHFLFLEMKTKQKVDINPSVVTGTGVNTKSALSREKMLYVGTVVKNREC